MQNSNPDKHEYMVRDYTDSDYSQVVSLWEETRLSNSARGDDERIIRESIQIGGRLLILEEVKTRKVTGTSWMTFDGRRIHLHHFGVLPGYQGKGLSKILLIESLRHVKAKGYQVKLEVHNTNKKAVALYEKFGFKRLGDYDVYIIRDLNEI